MSDSIRLHPEHGVNPTVVVCFWCGKETGELALCGYNGGKEAARESVIGYEPCQTCQAGMNQGFTIIEAKDTPKDKGQPQMFEGVYPTGRFVVITKEAAQRAFPQYAEGGNALMKPDDFAQLLEKFDVSN